MPVFDIGPNGEAIPRQRHPTWGQDMKLFHLQFGQVTIGHVAAVEGMTEEDFEFFWDRLLDQHDQIKAALVERPPPPNGKD